jgi:hypothetical protein
VPLNAAAEARLSHGAMALGVYTWLAQRLHRVAREALHTLFDLPPPPSQYEVKFGL